MILLIYHVHDLYRNLSPLIFTIQVISQPINLLRSTVLKPGQAEADHDLSVAQIMINLFQPTNLHDLGQADKYLSDLMKFSSAHQVPTR